MRIGLIHTETSREAYNKQNPPSPQVDVCIFPRACKVVKPENMPPSTRHNLVQRRNEVLTSKTDLPADNDRNFYQKAFQTSI